MSAHCCPSEGHVYSHRPTRVDCARNSIVKERDDAGDGQEEEEDQAFLEKGEEERNARSEEREATDGGVHGESFAGSAVASGGLDAFKGDFKIGRGIIS